jgi:hypothetical protein
MTGSFKREENMQHPVRKHEIFFKGIPVGIPHGHTRNYEGTAVDAPLLGNGDMTAAFAGTPEAPQFWVSTNDFWEQKTDNWYPALVSVGQGRPRPLGRLIFDIPALSGASVTIRQCLVDAKTTAEYTLDDSPALIMRSFVCAVENILICRFQSCLDMDIRALFCFPGECGYGVEHYSRFRRHDDSEAYINNSPTEYREDRGTVNWGFRRFCGTVDQETKLAFAGRFLPPAKPEPVSNKEPLLHCKTGDVVWYVLVLRSGEKTILPEKSAQARVETFGLEDATVMEELHNTWWEDYWKISSVEIEDEAVEKRYYLSNYILGSLCRDTVFPPNIFGVSTWDQPLWNGDYKINYNHQAPFWSLYAAGRYAQADCHDAPYLALEGQSRQIAIRESGHRGILMPCGIGPKGLVAENMIFHMKSMGALALMNMAMRWYTSYDRSYALKIYSFLRGIIEFWQEDLEFDGHYYHVVHDHAHEVSSPIDTLDTSSTLGFIRGAFKLILDIDKELCIDMEKHEKWRDILEKIAPYPTGEADEIHNIFTMPNIRLVDVLPKELLKDKEIFLLHRIGEDFSFFCAVHLQQVYPAGEIGLGSDSRLLRIAKDTLEIRIAQDKYYVTDKQGKPMLLRSAWNDFNHSCIFFPAAVRMGYDPEEVWKALRTLIVEWGLPNGYIKGNPHGIEHLSTVPNTIQEMMLLSHEGVLRFFRCWPKKVQPRAAFTDLRAYGAFRVSARLENGIVKDATIISEKGRDCSVEVFSDNPNVTCNGQSVDFKRNDNIITFSTKINMMYLIR